MMNHYIVRTKEKGTLLDILLPRGLYLPTYGDVFDNANKKLLIDYKNGDGDFFCQSKTFI